jgi:putative FmdB family regulatory protein
MSSASEDEAMPTYQYLCTSADCGERFDLVQSFTDPAASECPVCGSKPRKVFSPVGVVFKGSGFYRTDSRAAANGSKKPESSSSAGGEGSGTTGANGSGSKSGDASAKNGHSGGSKEPTKAAAKAAAS